MLSQSVQDALNNQINLEFASAYAYLAMSGYFESANLTGFAGWMRIQYQEELTHALRLFDHMHDRGGTVRLDAIAEPKAKFKSALEAFEAALAHEQKVTASIHNLYALAAKENDYATQTMLQWFINEQVEEERSVGQVVDWLKMAGDSPVALLMLDQKLGQRGSEAEDEGEAEAEA
ncbi:MAG: ferritin [Anaerolineales bacterium]|nr:ferritin [Anaerolineales bacterium]